MFAFSCVIPSDKISDFEKLFALNGEVTVEHWYDFSMVENSFGTVRFFNMFEGTIHACGYISKTYLRSKFVSDAVGFCQATELSTVLTTKPFKHERFWFEPLSSDVVFPVDAFAKEQLIARKWVPSVDIIAKDNANLTEKVREQEKQIADLTRQNECLAANYKAALERKTHVATTISEENEKLRERIRELKNDKPRSEVTVEELSSFVVSMRGTPDGFAVALLNMISEGHIVLVKQSS